MIRIGRDRSHLKVFQDRHARKNTASFRRMSDAEANDFVSRKAGDVPIFEPDGSGPGPGVAAYRHQQGRFAGAVGTDQSNDLPLFYFKIDILQRLDVPIECMDA